MPDIKLRDGSGVEQTYTGVDTITVPLADGSGNFTYGLTDEELTFSDIHYLLTNSTVPFFKRDFKRFKFIPTTYNGKKYFDFGDFVINLMYEKAIDLSDIVIDCDMVDTIYLSHTFNSSYVGKLPRIINANNLCIGNGAIFTNSNDVLTETEVLNFLNNFVY